MPAVEGWLNSLRLLVVALTALALGGAYQLPAPTAAAGDVPAFSASHERTSALIARAEHECRVPMPAAGAKERTGALPVFASLARVPAAQQVDQPAVCRRSVADHRRPGLVGVVELRI